MRLSVSPASAIPLAGCRAALGAALLSAVLMGGCAPQIALAPFPARPDTVVPGDLRGPFSGQVVDSATGNPIASALIYASWAYEVSGAVRAPLLAQTQSSVTRADGTYELRAVPGLSQPGALLRRFTLIIYKAGYLGYRSDLRYEDRTRRHDFSQLGLVVKLERFPDGESHARHLAFLGGGVELRRAAQAELVQASLELQDQLSANQSGPKKETKEPERPPLKAPEAAGLLTPALLQKVLATRLSFAAEPMPQVAAEGEAQPGEEAYEGNHLRAEGKGEIFDAALRLWRSRSAAGAEARYLRLKAVLATVGRVRESGAQPAAAGAAASDKLVAESAPAGKAARAATAADKALTLGDATLRVFDSKRRIYGVVVLLREPALVLQLSCGAGLCAREELATRLMSPIVTVASTTEGAP